MRVEKNDCMNPAPSIGVSSFGTKTRSGEDTQFMFDVSLLRDPGGQKQFKGLNGTYPQVVNWVKEDKRVATIISDCLIIADDLVKTKICADGGTTKLSPVSRWLSFSFEDHHGKWIAPAVAEAVADALSDAYHVVIVTHRDIQE